MACLTHVTPNCIHTISGFKEECGFVHLYCEQHCIFDKIEQNLTFLNNFYTTVCTNKANKFSKKLDMFERGDFPLQSDWC